MKAIKRFVAMSFPRQPMVQGVRKAVIARPWAGSRLARSLGTRLLWAPSSGDGNPLENGHWAMKVMKTSSSAVFYIHGTNQEDLLGQPVSHGCVRMRNDEVMEFFDLAPEGTPLCID
jgi:hypothetical protein